MSKQPEKQHVDYTEGSIIGSILKMGLPSMFGFLAQHIYAMVDTYWVAQLPGKEAGVAAITFFSNILWFFFAFNQLVGPGSVAIISRRYGEKAYDAAEKAIKECIVLKLFFGAVFGIVGFFCIEYMLILVGAEGEALTQGISYGRVMFLGLSVMYATYTIFTAMRGVANPQMAMFLMIGSNILNLILDPFFIFGWCGLPAWGIVGAAYASVLSYSITFLIGLVMFYGGRANVRLHLVGKETMSLVSMWKIIKIGIPAWLGSMSFSGSRLVITPLVAAFGTSVVAAYGVAMQVFGFGIMLLVGIGLGLSSLIGHNLGANKIDRAKKTGDQSLLLAISIMTAFGVLVYFTCEYYMGLFFDNPNTIAHGVAILQAFAFSFPFFGVFIMLEEIHMGVGLNTPTMIVSVIHGWGLQVLPILLLTQMGGLDQMAIWWVLAGSGVISSIGFYIYYRRGRWLEIKV
ncbi:MAG: MATE family efflux transporter [candidate division Zixibacteria bacterium]|nr:MATE family efflux transporter [candidate division Zixibacteria bacterium]